MRSSALLFLLACGREPEAPIVVPAASVTAPSRVEQPEAEAPPPPVAAPASGSSAPSPADRWRPAIENYSGAVRPGNQTSLGQAAVPFASYLVAIHRRLHVVFADRGLAELDKLPPGNPLSNPDLKVTVEIVLEPATGAVKKMGIVRPSGQTLFDIVALDSFQRSQPYGPAPAAIVSADGNVYIQWELSRDPAFECNTRGARPYILNQSPRP
jgi:hypothetical protein